MVVALIGLVVIVAIAISSASKSSSNPANDVVVRSIDGQIQVNVPPAWSVKTDLNDKAHLQVSDSSKEMYLIVLSDNKGDYTDMDLDRHANTTLDSLTKAMTTSTRNGPTRLTIDGKPAVQYEVRGEIKNLNVVYLHTTVETAKHYQQIVSWTLQSMYPEREDTLKRVIKSFKEN